ncbi:unnamed protein product [marine sediment metagenome]|uniref:Uncharacterized protein n=1 Tax=marine sediment metagenome TaxID=412755 RepID=X1QQ31_9ZZZZ
MIDRVDRPVEQLVDEILVMDCQSGSEKQITKSLLFIERGTKCAH